MWDMCTLLSSFIFFVAFFFYKETSWNIFLGITSQCWILSTRIKYCDTLNVRTRVAC